MTSKKKHHGAGLVATGWTVLVALFCSAERLMDSIGGCGLALVGIMLAFALMRVGESHLFRQRLRRCHLPRPAGKALEED